MRQTITLYIDGNRADCDTATLVQMTYTREELENPTIVRNSYSQNVSLPSTPANDRIFSCYFRNDYRRDTGFNPLVRLPFVLHSDTGEVLEQGYLKLNSVAYTGRMAHSYSCTLYGGLGGFFYGLSLNADGSKRSLADIAFGNLDGTYKKPKDTIISLTAATIADAWAYLDGAEPTNRWANYLNFAPCYNGIPDKFDADKAIVEYGQYHGILQFGGVQNKNYPYPGTNQYRVNLGNSHTEWEMRDLRAYLQRPVVNMAAFLDAVAYETGFSYSQAVADNFANEWMTLPMPPRTDAYTNYVMGQMMESFNPADVLIGLAKMYGLIFRHDPTTGLVQLITRDEFYNTGMPVIDLSQRLDRSRAQSVTPFLMASRFYDMQAEVKGGFADEYMDKYGRVYGSQRIDTGYEFEVKPVNITNGIIFRGACQFLDSSAMMQMFYDQLQGVYFTAASFEDVTFTGYSSDGSESEDVPVEPYVTATALKCYYNEDYPKYDIYDKPQFCDADRKGVDGAGVLLFFTGTEEMPESPQFTEHPDFMQWRLTDDDTALLALLNDGIPCWDMREDVGERVASLPRFSRWDAHNNRSLDYGQPREIAVPDADLPDYPVYEESWKYYIDDRYDPDARVLKCFVNLRGLGSLPELLRRFFFYDGSIWSLNKISNHSLTTLAPTECEFIRVHDVDNYTNGQLIR